MGKGGERGGEERGANLMPMAVASLLGGAVAAVIALLLLLVCAFMISSGTLPQTMDFQAVIAACVIGSFCGGTLTRKRWGSKPLLAGVSAGVIFFLILLTISLVVYGTMDIGGTGVGVMAGCLCGGAVSGLLGGRKKKRKKRG